jgi:hypothetical protein
MRTARRFLSAALAAGMSVSAAHAHTVIDDFETGTCHVVGISGGYFEVAVAVASPAHAMAGSRTIGLQSFVVGGLPARADLDAWTTADDALRIVFPPDGGIATLEYEPPSPVDLTAGGLNDRIEVAFSALTLGANLTLAVWDAGGGQDGVLLVPSAGANVFTFLALSDADLTQVTRLQVRINGPAGTHDLRDIRAMRRDAFAIRFDVPTETIVAPPYPLPFFEFLVTDGAPSDRLRVRLANAISQVTGGPAPLRFAAMDSGESGAGFAALLTTHWNQPGVPVATSRFEFDVDLDALAGVDPAPFLPALPVAAPTPTGFVVDFDVYLRGDDGAVTRTSRRQMAFDTVPGQALQLAGIQVHAPALAPSLPGADDERLAGELSGFRLTLDAVRTGDVDPGEPLFEVSLTGDCQPVATTAVPIAGAIDGRAFLALPTVTRTGTELRLARPAASAGIIDLFDAAGRRVRRLEVARGDAACHWDGRDDGGRAVAAGLYVARLTDESPFVRTTRVVVTR